jgi:hypothetical protein
VAQGIEWVSLDLHTVVGTWLHLAETAHATRGSDSRLASSDMGGLVERTLRTSSRIGHALCTSTTSQKACAPSSTRARHGTWGALSWPGSIPMIRVAPTSAVA